MNPHTKRVIINIVWVFAITFFILFVVISYGMFEIEIDRCHEAYNKLDISICDRIEVVHTIIPFTWSTKCYCENYDRIYFDMEEKK